MGKQVACTCDAFVEALRTAFLERIGDEHFLASREGGMGNFHSLIYGPRISFCPFCGASLDKPVTLPRAEVRR
jgi:hypothetical protein